MEVIAELFLTFFRITEAIAIYLIFGLIVAGILHEFINDSHIKKHLGNDSFFDTLKATLLGIPLPMCSCSVIPFSLSLRKSGASKGSVSSFFISTPMTGVDSIAPTYGIFGLPIAILRVLSSIISALLCGVLINKFDNGKMEKTEEEESSCGSCCGNSCSSTIPKKRTILDRVKSIYDYSFNQLVSDIAKPMLLGLVFAAIFTTLIPTDIKALFSNDLLNYLLVLVVAIPLYVCSLSAIPIALTLLSMGFSFGAAFIFLSAAPATNIITAGIVKNMLGTKSLIIYLFSIIVPTLIFAYFIDQFLIVDTQSLVSSVVEEEGSIITNIFAFILLGLLFAKTIRKS